MRFRDFQQGDLITFLKPEDPKQRLNVYLVLKFEEVMSPGCMVEIRITTFDLESQEPELFVLSYTDEPDPHLIWPQYYGSLLFPCPRMGWNYVKLEDETP